MATPTATAATTAASTTTPLRLPRLTLIVAVTPSNGIGRAGTLPWPRIPAEMSYFSRVTKRIVPSSSSLATSARTSPVQNAVIMGRKTWDSIPAKFRPLPGRVNVVISRSAGQLDLGETKGEAHAVGSLQAALELLATRGADGRASGSDEGAGTAETAEGGKVEVAKAMAEEGKVDIGRVFVIGGAQIYAEAVARPEADAVLLTRIKKEYECDTFFPVKLSESEGGEAGWRLGGSAERDEFIGEEAPGGEEWEVELWRRKDRD